MAYLGKTPINTAEHPIYSKFTGVDWALLFMGAYGQIDGAHHKTWVIDQTARILNGTPVLVTMTKWDDRPDEYRFETGEPSEAYLEWVAQRKAGRDGPDTHYYDEGIAP